MARTKAEHAAQMRMWRKNNRVYYNRCNRAYKHKTKKKVGIQNKKSYLKNRTARKAYQRAWRKKHNKKARASVWKSALRARYGIEIDYYEKLLKRPCKICLRKSECLDHDHKTGLVRAALCQRCNRGLGHFDDSPRLLLRAVTYLKKKR